MLDNLYYYLRGSLGFSLLVCGILSVISNDRRRRGLRSFGVLYLAGGSLFSMSALDPIARLPLELDNLVYQTLMLLIGLALVDLSIYLFGNERRPGSARHLMVTGVLYQAALVLLPLLDYLLPGRPVLLNVEDGIVREPLHEIAMQAAYIWPVAAIVSAIAMARCSPADVDAERPGVKPLITGLALLVPLFVLIAVCLSLELGALYRIGHILLEGLLLSFYLYAARNPGFLQRFRTEVGEEHALRLCLSSDEIASIEKSLSSRPEMQRMILDEKLNLKRLSTQIGVPAYRLSVYFSSRLGTTFPAWRNQLRIEYVAARMAERPDLTILEISLEAGYRSRASFYDQFSRIMGMTPSEYRRRIAVLDRCSHEPQRPDSLGTE